MRPLASLGSVALTLCLAAAASAADDGYLAPSLVRVHHDGDPRPAIQRVLDADGDVVARSREWFDALVPREALGFLRGMGLGPGNALEVRLENADDEVAAYRGRTDAGAYHTYGEVKQVIDQLVAARPDIIEYEAIGQTVEGRPIHAVRIASQGRDVEQPSFFICGAHHAREWISVEVPVATMKWMVENYGEDEQATALVDSRETWIVPVVNPDGLEYSQNHARMWRKNRRDNGNGSMGVDPNRNYGYNWGLPGASPSPSSDTYRGPAPFSEPEIAAVRDLARREGFVSALSFHSYSQLVLWPWGYTYDPAPDEDVLAYHGRKMGALTGYTPQQSSDLYPTSGDFDDWFYGELGALCYTFELGTQFVPPESQIPGIVAKNLDAVRYFLQHCAEPFPLMTHGGIPDTTDTEGPYPATLTLSRRYQADDPVESATMVFRVPGADEAVRVPMTKGAEGTYSAIIPPAGYGSYEYHFEVAEVGGEAHRFPAEGVHSFQVVERLVLVVDDDKGKGYEAAYVEALSGMGVPFRVTAGPVAEAELLGASAVVWFCGDDSSSSLDDGEQAKLEAYLAAGGELLLFGQDIGYDIKGTAFYKDRLKSEYKDDKSGIDGLVGAEGTFLAGFTGHLNSGDAVKQRYPEVVKARAGGVETMTYDGSTKVAAVAVAGDYRVAYFGFGLEGVDGAEARAELMQRSLDWLGEDGAVRKLRRASALAASAGHDPVALARLEAEVLDAARALGRAGDLEGLIALQGAAPSAVRGPLARAYHQAAFGR